jgi:hypothetical protein
MNMHLPPPREISLYEHQSVSVERMRALMREGLRRLILVAPISTS